jgi:hypothetical protein
MNLKGSYRARCTLVRTSLDYLNSYRVLPLNRPDYCPGGIKTELARHVNLSGISEVLLVSIISTPLVTTTQSILFRTQFSGLLHMAPYPNYMRGQRLRGRTCLERHALSPSLFQNNFNFLLQYLIPWARLDDSRADTRDEEAGRKLWAWLEEQVKLH